MFRNRIFANRRNHTDDINRKINNGGSAKPNIVLWDNSITTKTFVHNTIPKSTISYRSETLQIESRKTAKLSSTETDFWRRSARRILY